MTLEIGRNLLHYRLVEKIGEGGMGVVWRAVDTRLNRDVAIKVLPETLSDDPERLARFDREARALATLQHPNIASIYGFEKHEEVRFLVMELAEGEDLSARMARGAMPVEETVELAVQLAEGLEAAHRVGIVHRDLKPANLKVAPDGQLKILDFGLARAYSDDGGVDSTPEHSPTITAAMTRMGTILGTAGYMSPEQARGKSVDQRADLWAFGVIVFEMLSGRSLFTGETVSDTMAAVLRADLEWDALPSRTAPNLRRLLRRCLARNPKQRIHSAADARLDLLDAEEAPEVHTAAGRGWMPIALVVLALAILAAAWIFRPGAGPDHGTASPLVADLAPRNGRLFALELSGASALTLSPDGKFVVYGAAQPGEDHRLFVRELATGIEREIAGTDRAQYPFWSPDGEHLGYFAGDALRRVRLAGGAPRVLSDAPNGKGGSWSNNGWILFTRGASGVIEAVREDGTELRAITSAEDKPVSFSHRFPRFLPDGNHFIYIARNAEGGTDAAPHALMLGSLSGDEPRLLGWSSSQAELVEGQLLSCVGASLYASTLDPSTLRLKDDRRVLAEKVAVKSEAAFGLFSAAPGKLAYHAAHAEPQSLLLVYDHDGNKLRNIETPHHAISIAASPDGQKLMAGLIDPITGKWVPWLYDLARDSWTPVAVEGDTSDVHWVSNEQLVYVEGGRRILRIMLGGLEEPELLHESEVAVSITSVSSEAGLLVFERPTTDRSWDLYALNLATGDAPQPIVSTSGDDVNGVVSPDGRWIAYVANHHGAWHAFVQSTEGGARRQQLTSGSGGAVSGWHPSGERFYVTLREGGLQEMTLRAGAAGFEIGESRFVLNANDEAFRYRVPETDEYTLLASTDDRLFILARRSAPGKNMVGHLILGW